MFHINFYIFRYLTDCELWLWHFLGNFGHLSVSWPIGVQLVVFFCSSVSVVLLTPQGSPGISTRCNCRVIILASPQYFNCSRDDILIALGAEQPTKLCKPRRKMRGKVRFRSNRFNPPPHACFWPAQGGTFVAVSFVSLWRGASNEAIFIAVLFASCYVLW